MRTLAGEQFQMKYRAYEEGRRAYLQAWERLIIQQQEEKKNQRGITIEPTAAKHTTCKEADRLMNDLLNHPAEFIFPTGKLDDLNNFLDRCCRICEGQCWLAAYLFGESR
jgi:hypothetical protein